MENEETVTGAALDSLTREELEAENGRLRAALEEAGIDARRLVRSPLIFRLHWLRSGGIMLPLRFRPRHQGRLSSSFRFGSLFREPQGL